MLRDPLALPVAREVLTHAGGGCRADGLLRVLQRDRAQAGGEDERWRIGGRAAVLEQEVAELKKRKADSDDHDPLQEVFADIPEDAEGEMDIGFVEVIKLTDKWIAEVKEEMIADEGFDDEDAEAAWDDVHGGALPAEAVREARSEEVGFMQHRGIWEVVPVTLCWKLTGKGPVSVRWVDTNKGSEAEMNIRSRLMARDFKGGDKGRDDLFAETPPLEAKRMLFSRAATRRRDGRQ